MIEKTKIIKQASELMHEGHLNGAYNYNNTFCKNSKKNNKHGNFGEDVFAELVGMTDESGVPYRNPNPIASVDFPIEIVERSYLPRDLCYGHGIEFKCINVKKRHSVKIGDAGINAQLLKTGGYIFGGFIWDGIPENIIDLKFWRFGLDCVDEMSIMASEYIRNLLVHKTHEYFTYGYDDINGEVRSLNEELRKTSSSLSLSSGLRRSNPSKRCVQSVTKKAVFDRASELVLD